MRGFCEKCGGQFDDQMLCPNCGAQLQTRFVPTKTVLLPTEEALDALERTPFMNRVGVGALLVTGCFVAGWHLLVGLSGTPEPTTLDLPSDLFVGLLSSSVFLGALVSGTANHRAEISGFILGLLSATALFTFNFLHDIVSPQEWLIGMPIMQGLIGSLAGFVGRMLYLPAPRFRSPVKAEARVAQTKKKSVPIGWVNILIAVVAANVTLVYAEPIRQKLVSLFSSGGSSHGASQFVVWEITMLGTFLAGITAGINRRAGFRQGLLAGTFTTVGFVTAVAQRGASNLPAADFWIAQLSLAQDSIGLYVVLAVSILLTVTLGGWLGSHLFPPRRRQR